MKKLILPALICLSGALYSQCPTAYSTTGNSTFCQGASKTIRVSSSQVGVIYDLRIGVTPNDVSAGQPPRDGTGAALTWTVIAESTTTYTVLATNTTFGCSRYMNGSATLTVNPSSPMYAAHLTNACSGTAEILMLGSTPGVNYMLRRGSTNVTTTSQAGTGGVLTWSAIGTAGSYTIFATNTTTGCTRIVTSPMSVGALPAAYNTTGNVSGCQGPLRTIRLSNSQTSTAYELRIGLAPNDVSAGLPVQPGVAGMALTWQVAPAATTVYTVRATSQSTGCSRIMNGSATVTISASTLSVFTLTTLATCGNTPRINMSGSEVGVNYQLKQDGLPVTISGQSTVIGGTGAGVSWVYSTLAGTYEVEAIRVSTGCVRQMGSVMLNGHVVDYEFYGGMQCGNQSALIQLSDTQTDVRYQVKGFVSGVGTVELGSPVMGTGSMMSISVDPDYEFCVGLLCTPMAVESIWVEAINPSTNCAREFPSINLVWRPFPVSLALSQVSQCPGPGAIQLHNSQADVSYDLYREGSLQSSKQGINGTLSWDIIADGTYTISSHRLGCPGTVTGSAQFMPRPVSYVTTLPPTVCHPGDAAIITLSGSDTGVFYQLRSGSGSNVVNEGDAVAGTGGGLSWEIHPMDTRPYFIEAVNNGTGCSWQMEGAGQVTIALQIQNFVVERTGCASPMTGTIALSGSQVGILYQLYDPSTMSNFGTAQAGTGGVISWTPSPGEWAVRASVPGTTCSTELGTVTFHAAPLDFPVTAPTTLCQSSQATFNLSGSRPGDSYKLIHTVYEVVPFIGTVAQNTVVDSRPGHPSGGAIILVDEDVQETAEYRIEVTNNASGCYRNFPTVYNLIVNTAPPVSDLVAGESTCIGTGTPGVRLTSSSAGMSYQLTTGTPVGPAVIGDSGPISWTVSIPTAHFVIATNPQNGCTRNMNGFVNFGVTPESYDLEFSDGMPLICPGTEKKIVLQGSELDHHYTLYRNGELFQGPVQGTGASIQFDSELVAGDYFVNAVELNSQCSIATSALTAIALPQLQFFDISVTGTCSSQTVTLNGSQVGYQYLIYEHGDLIDIQQGNGGPISRVTYDAGLVEIYASSPCGDVLMDAVHLGSPIPHTYSLVGDIPGCSPYEYYIKLNNSQIGVEYAPIVEVWFGGTHNLESFVPGTGGPLYIPIPAEWASTIVHVKEYRARARNIYTGCIVNMIGDSDMYSGVTCSAARVRSPNEIVVDEQAGEKLTVEETVEKVYPNPARDVVTISFGSKTDITSVSILSPGAKQIFSCSTIPDDREINVDVSDFPAGLYIVRLGGSSDMRFLKFIKGR